jgi:hypothetical protein
MAYFKVQQFKGMVPAVSSKLLAEQFAVDAKNADFASGQVGLLNSDSEIQTLTGGSRKSIYLDSSNNWFQWDDANVSVVEGPIPDDTAGRLYWTGEDYPRVGIAASMISGTTYPAVSYRLGVPAPPNPPQAARTGTADEAQTPNDVSYVYTFVTTLGEEGPPSPPTAAQELTDTENVDITMPTGDQPSGNYYFSTGAKKRIYRSNSGSTNTTFQFVGEVNFTATQFTDTRASHELGEVLPSDTWIAPPDDNSTLYPSGPLMGITALANGMFAGFSGKRLCISEAYLPHAWPIAYRITLDEEIVAIATTGAGLVCLTADSTYFVTGSDPSAMSASKLDIAQACVNKDSVVDMGSYVLYAGPDGLVAVSGGEAQLVTEGLVTPKQWNANFAPGSIKAFKYEETYVAFYTDSGANEGWIYDPRSEDTSLIKLSTGSQEIEGGYQDPRDGSLYYISANKIHKFQGDATTFREAEWKSKVFVADRPVAMSWVGVDFSTESGTGGAIVSVYADGTLVLSVRFGANINGYTLTTYTPTGIGNVSLAEPICRLPAVTAKEWQLKVKGRRFVDSICIAQSIDEIKNA